MGAAPQRNYEYKIFRAGVYLGSLQNVVSPFGYNQNVNSTGAQLVITVGQSADVSDLPPDPIRDETGDPILDETGDIIYDEQAAEIVGDGNDQILIRNDNDVQVWEFSDDHINGVIVYSGYISKWKGNWGGDDDIIITCLNHSQDLVNYITPGSVADSLDQQQATDGDGLSIFGTRRYGQTFTTGVGVSNLSKLYLKLNGAASGTRTFTIKVWPNPTAATAGTGLLAEASVSLPADPTFTYIVCPIIFSSPIPVSPSTQYFFSIEIDSGAINGDTNTWAGIDMVYSDVYAGGTMWRFASPSLVWDQASGMSGYDAWFKTYYSFNSTEVTYTNQDPSTTLTTVMDYYNGLGGEVAKPPGGYALTGIIAPKTSFKINTILEAIQKIVALAPSDWYWYVDPATEILYFRQTSTTVQHRFIKGVHIQQVTIEATKEEIINVVYFSGGKIVAENLFVLVTDAQSLTQNRRGIARLSDNTVTDTSTAQLIAQNYINQHNEQTYTTTIIIPCAVYDTSTLDVGEIVGFGGMGQLVDALNFQIVGKAINDNDVTLTLGVLLPRQTALATQLRQELTALQTVDNPDTPS